MPNVFPRFWAVACIPLFRLYRPSYRIPAPHLSNAPDQKRAGALILAIISAPVFCILMLGAAHQLKHWYDLSPNSISAFFYVTYQLPL